MGAAREEVQSLMEADEALHSLKDILTVHDDPSKDVVQVEGMICVGVPVGSPAFVQAFVKEKTKTMVTKNLCTSTHTATAAETLHTV